MLTTILACGPYFDQTAVFASVILFLLVKPLAYFAFIQAFRYRVSRSIPMRFGQAAWLAALRSVVGFVATSLAALGMLLFQRDELLAASWVFLYVERVAAWWLIGQRGAGLRGRRLAGWVISGTAINAAFDVAALVGLMHGWVPMTLVTLGVLAFIFVLHKFGRRHFLRARFARTDRCRLCGYDLTGNLSGRCPECGTAIDGCGMPLFTAST